MLEAGISLIATSLPSLHFLVTKHSLHSFAANIRSAFSLSPLQSHRSNNGSEDQSRYLKMQQNGSMASDVPVVGRKREDWEGAGGVDTFAMYDMEHAVPVREPGVVHVRSELRQQGNIVWGEFRRWWLLQHPHTPWHQSRFLLRHHASQDQHLGTWRRSFPSWTWIERNLRSG